MLYSVREIAGQLGVSKSTARRYLKKIQAVPVETVHESVSGAGSKQVEFSYEESVIDDIKVILKKRDTGADASQEKVETVHESVSGAVDGVVYDALLKQLEVKDQQIASLQKALDQEQQLHAVAENRLKAIEDKQSASAPEEKKSLWKRIFGNHN